MRKTITKTLIEQLGSHQRVSEVVDKHKEFKPVLDSILSSVVSESRKIVDRISSKSMSKIVAESINKIEDHGNS